MQLAQQVPEVALVLASVFLSPACFSGNVPRHSSEKPRTFLRFDHREGRLLLNARRTGNGWVWLRLISLHILMILEVNISKAHSPASQGALLLLPIPSPASRLASAR